MRVLFCHDGPLKKDEHNNFYGSAHNDEMFQRYHAIADELNVIMRVNKILSFGAGKQLSKITLPNFSVDEIPNISSIKGLLLEKGNAKKRIRSAVNDADFIVVRLPSIIGFHAFDYARILNKPCLVEVVGCPWDTFRNHSLVGKLVAPIMYYKIKKRVESASHVLYVTNKFLQSRYPTKGKSIGCSDVSLPNFESKILEERLEKISNITFDSPIIIGTTGAVNVKYKGQDDVIKAISILNAEGHNFEYHLVGGGDNNYLKNLAQKLGIKDKVKFIGSLPHKDIFSYLDNIDIYIQPSKTEGMPRALIEAMSRGLPSIGSLAGGIPELLNHKLTFKTGNVNDIYRAIKMVDKKTMLEEANRSFEKSKEFEKAVLDEKRITFFKEFIGGDKVD